LNGGCVLELKTTLVIRKTREDKVNPWVDAVRRMSGYRES
jgi:hypothetical protein